MESLNAQLWHVRQDHDGMSYITFMIPSSDLVKVLAVSTLVNRGLKLSVEPDINYEITENA